MNNSQLLYKISSLRYTVRMKEAEYTKAVIAGEQSNIELNQNALKILKADLYTLILAFNSSLVNDHSYSSKTAKKERWWQRLFSFRS